MAGGRVTCNHEAILGDHDVIVPGGLGEELKLNQCSLELLPSLVIPGEMVSTATVTQRSAGMRHRG